MAEKEVPFVREREAGKDDEEGKERYLDTKNLNKEWGNNCLEQHMHIMTQIETRVNSVLQTMHLAYNIVVGSIFLPCGNIENWGTYEVRFLEFFTTNVWKFNIACADLHWENSIVSAWKLPTFQLFSRKYLSWFLGFLLIVKTRS